jgi:subtilase family serine protease
MRGRMRRIRALVSAAAVLVTTVSTVAVTSPAAAAVPSAKSGGFSLLDFGCANPANHLSLDKLLPARRGKLSAGATCYGKVRVPKGAAGPAATTAPTGLAPADIQSAYGLTGRASGGATVAVVDAYDDPKAESDLAVYRSQYHLPACTTANGCFRKVNQSGAASPLPSADAGWSEEISLDLDAISAACPDCKILLVEADSSQTGPLTTAVDAAVRLGAAAVSLSWGGTEDNTITAADVHLNHPGTAITASTGDNGYGVSWPASSPYVTAVGGTTLTKAAGTARGWTETVWSGAGSGCSAFEPKPSWQHDTGCVNRTVGDVSADADPNSGLAVYDSYNSCTFTGALNFLCSVLELFGLVQGANGWIQVGGTSLSSPLVASVYALAGGTHDAAGSVYANPSALNDVTSGSNGSCGGSYLCTAGAGYDGPTGLGTPNGVAAFAAAP